MEERERLHCDTCRYELIPSIHEGIMYCHHCRRAKFPCIRCQEYKVEDSEALCSSCQHYIEDHW